MTLGTKGKILLGYRLWQGYKRWSKEADMLGGVGGWLKSKKGMAMLTGLLAVVLGDKGLGLSPEAIQAIVALVASYIVGQGVADHGKEKAKVEAGK